jgi:hypothetical protein
MRWDVRFVPEADISRCNRPCPLYPSKADIGVQFDCAGVFFRANGCHKNAEDKLPTSALPLKADIEPTRA